MKNEMGSTKGKGNKNIFRDVTVTLFSLLEWWEQKPEYNGMRKWKSCVKFKCLRKRSTE